MHVQQSLVLQRLSYAAPGITIQLHKAGDRVARHTRIPYTSAISQERYLLIYNKTCFLATGLEAAIAEPRMSMLRKPDTHDAIDVLIIFVRFLGRRRKHSGEKKGSFLAWPESFLHKRLPSASFVFWEYNISKKYPNQEDSDHSERDYLLEKAHELLRDIVGISYLSSCIQRKLF